MNSHYRRTNFIWIIILSFLLLPAGGSLGLGKGIVGDEMTELIIEPDSALPPKLVSTIGWTKTPFSGSQADYFTAIKDSVISVSSGSTNCIILLKDPNGDNVKSWLGYSAISHQATMTGTYQIQKTTGSGGCNHSYHVNHSRNINHANLISGTENNELTWKFSDPEPSNYTVLANGETYIPTATWDGSDITIDVDGIQGEGPVDVMIAVQNLNGSEIRDTVKINLTDELKPQILEQDYFSFAYGSSENTITWSILDTNPGIYEISYRDPEMNQLNITSDTWSNESPVLLNLDQMDLDLGVHNFTLTAIDEFGNQNSSTVLVTVYDGERPQIQVSISNGTKIRGDTVLSVGITDEHGLQSLTYEWNNNGTEFDVPTSGNNSVSLNLNLPVEETTHTLNITATDTTHITSEIYLFTVNNAIAQVDASIEQWTTHKSGTAIQFEISDDDLTEVIYRWDNDSETSDTPTSPYLLNTTLPEGDGDHIFHLFTNDDLGNSNNWTYSFTTDDSAPKIILDSGIVEFNHTLEVRQFSLTVNDMSDSEIKIFKNAELIFQDTLASGQNSVSLKTYLNDLKIGIYNFTVLVIDEVGNFNSSTIMIRIVDDIRPTIGYNGGYLFRPNSEISIAITDNEPGVVVHTKWNDDPEIVNEVSNSAITVSTPDADGMHNLEVRATDVEGNVQRLSLQFEVDGTAPTIAPLGTLSPTTPTTVTMDLFTVKADVTDANEIKRVEVWISSLKDGEATNFSDIGYQYEINFAPYSDGSHTLVFVAYDILGNVQQTQDLLLELSRTTSTSTSSTSSSDTPDTQTHKSEERETREIQGFSFYISLSSVLILAVVNVRACRRR